MIELNIPIVKKGIKIPSVRYTINKSYGLDISFYLRRPNDSEANIRAEYLISRMLKKKYFKNRELCGHMEINKYKAGKNFVKIKIFEI